MTHLQDPTSKGVWAVRVAGILLLVYTLVMTFGVPLGPGIEDVQVIALEREGQQAQFELVVHGHGTHFDDATTRVFLKRDKHLISAT